MGIERSLKNLGQAIRRQIDQGAAHLGIISSDRPTLENQLKARGMQTEIPRPTTAEAAKQFPIKDPFGFW